MRFARMHRRNALKTCMLLSTSAFIALVIEVDCVTANRSPVEDIQMNHPASMTTAHPAPGPYDFLFNPRSIAVIGASNNGLKPGGRVINNISTHGYSGRLWAVNPNTCLLYTSDAADDN